MTRFDVVVAGGGPAGTAAAISLAAAGYSVLLVERSNYQSWRVGETLPPEVQVPLRELGVWERFLREAQLPSHGIHAVWGSDDLYENDFIFNAYGTGWHVDRRRFDSMLAVYAQDCGATLLQGSWITGISWEGDSWRIQLAGDGVQTVRSGFAVDASGRTAKIGTLLGASRKTVDHMIGIVGFFAAKSAGANVDPVLLLESDRDGWWYSAPLPDASLLVAYMTDRDLFTCANHLRAALWLEKLSGTTHTLARTKDFRRKGKIVVQSAASGYLDPAGGENWMAVGDAACTHDPLSADGITKALSQGLHAPAVMRDPILGPAEHTATVANSFEEYRRLRCEYYRRETRWADCFWKRRQLDSSEQE